MSNDLAIGIVGLSDGMTPTYAPDARWCMWSIHEIFTGAIGNNKHIPKVLDYVIEPETGATYKVVDLDNMTFVPTLEPITLHASTTTDSINSISSDNFRLYYDKSVYPYTLQVDGFMYVYSNDATVARVYRGTFIEPENLISQKYDQSGNLIGHDFNLYLAAMNSHDNHAIKAFSGCNTRAELVNGETCTVVVYSSSGKELTRTHVIVEESSFVAQAYSEQKYITQIYLKSAFINTSQPDVVNYPVNMPVTSFNPIGVVQFNDGTELEYPVDGTKFDLFGLDQFVSTIIGHKVPLVLSYKLGQDEAGLASVTTDNYYATRPYQLVVSEPNTSYNVKLFVYPVWVNAVAGYSYKIYLMNLDRNVLFDVTSKVSLTQQSNAFSPTAYGLTQRITFMIDLANVSGIYQHFLYVQSVDIVLRGPANDTSVTNIWEVSTQVPTTVTNYGSGLKATKDQVIATRLKIDNGLDTVAKFLEKLYTPTQPIVNPVTELHPITPTHLDVIANGETVRLPIENYTQWIGYQSAINLYSNVDIVFLKETPTGFLKLSVASLCVRN